MIKKTNNRNFTYEKLHICNVNKPDIMTKQTHIAKQKHRNYKASVNPLNPELNPICYLLALLGAHHFLHVSRIRVKSLTLRLLMSYIWSTHSSAGERPAPARLLRSWVRIPPGAWIFVCCECRVLTGRSLCDELITCPEESYRLCYVVLCDLKTSRIVAPYI